jgi:hypothetical protein
MSWTVMEEWTNYIKQGPSLDIYSSLASQVFSVPSPQQPTTFLNPEPDKSTQGLHGLVRNALILSFHLILGLSSGLIP